jgi:hypothetical protein
MSAAERTPRFFPVPQQGPNQKKIYYDVYRFSNPRRKGGKRYTWEEMTRHSNHADILPYTQKQYPFSISERFMIPNDIVVFRNKHGSKDDMVQMTSSLRVPEAGDWESLSLPLSSASDASGHSLMNTPDVGDDSSVVHTPIPEWLVNACDDLPFKGLWRDACADPRFLNVIKSQIPVKKNLTVKLSELSRTLRCKLGAAAWLWNPANIHWYKPPKSRKGQEIVSPDYVPMYWTNLYPQVRRLAEKEIGMSIHVGSWYTIFCSVVQCLDWSGNKPAYADDVGGWMVGASNKFKQRLCDKVNSKKMRGSINNLKYTAECWPSENFPFLSEQASICRRLGFGFKLTDRTHILCKSMFIEDSQKKLDRVACLKSPSGRSITSTTSSTCSSGRGTGGRGRSTRNSTRAAPVCYSGRSPLSSYYLSFDEKKAYMLIQIFDDIKLTSAGAALSMQVYTTASIKDLKREGLPFPLYDVKGKKFVYQPSCNSYA